MSFTKNDYEIRGEETVIFLKRKNGDILETFIDTSDLPMLKCFNVRWYAYLSKPLNSFYAFGNTRLENGKPTVIPVHRYIMKPGKGYVIDHFDHHTLNNRRSNLRIVTKAENLQNLKGAMSHNKSSGLRGVSWNKGRRKWEAYVMSNDKKIYLGCYDTKEQANATVSLYRAMYMPYSQDASNI